MKADVRYEDPIPRADAFLGANINPGRTMPTPHWHDCLEITYVYQGRGRHLIGTEEVAFTSGTLFVIPPGVPHQTLRDPHDPHWNLTMYIRPEVTALFGEGATRFAIQTTGCPVVRSAGTVGRQWESLISSVHNECGVVPPIGGLAAAARLMEACVLICRCEDAVAAVPHPRSVLGRSVSSRHIQEAVAYIEGHMTERLSLAILARHLGLNERYTSSLFRREVGMPFNRYLALRRLRRAWTLISDTDAPVDEVAGLCGFSSKATFYRRFRACFGTPPSACRHSGPR